jgi:hypothetical protein
MSKSITVALPEKGMVSIAGQSPDQGAYADATSCVACGEASGKASQQYTIYKSEANPEKTTTDLANKGLTTRRFQPSNSQDK